VPEEPTNPEGYYKKEKFDDQADLSSKPSWQPLEPKSEANEDLASILQLEFKDLFPSTPSGQATLVKPDKSPEQSFTPHDQAVELAALAATVFDTTFYLVPRSNEHYLLGELALSLRVWLPGLCELYGWELNCLSIRPDYLKWTLLDFPECLTQKVLVVVRRWTSDRIFKDFPALQADPLEQDFWAPGYLVDTQNRDFPTQLLIARVSRNRV
jgi:REP element-mobilizing transposase RayT